MNVTQIELLLGREFAQKDRSFLEYSVPREDILERLRDLKRPFFLIIAPRGSGKSGLLLMLEDELRRFHGMSVCVIKKYYEDVTFPADASDIDTSMQRWLTILLQWIVAEIGLTIEIPETSDEIYAVELAEALGMRNRQNTARNLGHPDTSVLKFVAKRLLDKMGKKFWLLLDEMDDYYSNTIERNIALVGLLQACDAATDISNNILIRLTIRPHIHTLLKTNYDVVQKFRDSEIGLSWNDVQLRDLLVRRIQRFDSNTSRNQIELVLNANPPDRRQASREACEIIGRYIADFDSSFTHDGRSDYRALQTLSLRRPRWMIEYCWLALKHAPGDFADIVALIKAMHEFGHNRLQSLAGEHKVHFPDLMTWMNRLAAARRSKFGSSYSFRDVLIEHVVRDETISLSDHPAKPSEVAQALKIAQALYMLEIVRAHQSAGGKDDHRFYSYYDSPELLSSWSTRANLTWEMHQTFARALNIIDNRTFRVGGEVRVFGEKRLGRTGKNKKGAPRNKEDWRHQKVISDPDLGHT